MLFKALHIVCMVIATIASLRADDAEESMRKDIPPQVKFLRVFGGDDESMPPIAVCSRPTNSQKPTISFNFTHVTIELDIQSPTPPQMFVIFTHCNADWTEHDNPFLNDPGLLRTSNIDWSLAPPASLWYSYKGILKVPNDHVKLNVGGNWKAKFYLYDDPSIPIATAKFFVVDPRVETRMNVIGDFYSPKKTVYSSGAYSIEANVRSVEGMNDGQLNTAVFYRLNRYEEPFIVSDMISYQDVNERIHAYPLQTMIVGFGMTGRRFRINHIPAENEYRVLNLADFSLFPRSNALLRMWTPELWRNASFMEKSDGGFMNTRFLPYEERGYVQFEFLLNTQLVQAEHEVFVSGSFNNWKPDASWLMKWDEETKLYRLRQWIPRGRHSYLYLTGEVDADTRKAIRMTAEEFEGNTARAGHPFIGLIYYREFGMGGYDSIVGIAGGSVYGSW
ncbi:MAG: DUF5103 domain-containing protein [Bacteroidetes bacterium]|nr:DUF5103 domain-containing protein [Bacteroidota bacterium]